MEPATTDEPIVTDLWFIISIVLRPLPFSSLELNPTHHDSYHRGKYNNVPAEKGGQTLSTGLDFPRACCPASNESSQDRSSPDVQPPWNKERKVIARCNGIGRDIRTQRRETECEGTKECGRTICPQADDRGWIPIHSAIDGLARRCDDYSNE